MRELPNYLKVSAYDSLGLSVAKHGLTLTVPEILQEMDYVDFTKLYDHRVGTFNEVNDAYFMRRLTFKASTDEEKEIHFKLDKRVCRIDFSSFEKEEINLLDLMKIICFNPEIDVMFQSLADVPGRYVFSSSKKSEDVICYYCNNHEDSFNCECFAKTDTKGNIIKLGNKGKILAQLLFEFGKDQKLEGYFRKVPKSDEEKAIYEATLMSTYYRKDLVLS
jgi:hypothetical protein